MPPPTVQGTLGVAPPAFVRMVSPRDAWGDPSDPIDERVPTAVEAFFLRRHKSPFSFFLVESDEDLRRIAVALNGNRHDPHDRLDLLAFLPSELSAAGITGAQTAGKTRCGYANRRHYDMEASRAEQLEALCRAAMQAGRKVGWCPKPQMREVHGMAQAEKCPAALAVSPGCEVSECSPAGGGG